MRKNSLLFSAVFLFILVLLSLQCSAYIKSSVSGLSSGVLSGGLSSSGGQWVADNTMCEAGQDFAVQIAPFGCEPAVVRSDLLEEQNVPVFCQLAATKINPLISIDAIDSISFSGQQLPKEVSGVGFFPAQAALGVQGKLNSPILNNIGYAVIVLKKQENESSMPDSISGNLTATLKYDLKNAYGIGDTMFYLPEISEDSVWEDSKNQYSFWNGRGYLRAESISFEDARISIHTSTNKIGTISLDKGQTSNEIFLPGFDCLVGVKLKLEDLTSPDTKAILKVNGDTLQLNNGEKFLENKCQVLEITKRGLTKKVEISCKDDEGTNRFELVLAPKIKIKIGDEEKEVGIGEYLYQGTQIVKVGGSDVPKQVYVYLGYIGTKGDTGKLEDSYVVLVSTPLDNGLSLSSSDISNYANRAEGIYSNIYRDKGKILGLIAQQGATARQTGTTFISSVKSSTDLKYIPYADYDEFFNDNVFSKIQNFALSEEDKNKLKSKEFVGKEIRIIDFASPVNRVFDSEKGVLNYYSSASNDYSEIIKSYAGEKDPTLEENLVKELGIESTLGSEAISKHIVLASYLNQKENIKELCEDFNSLSSGASILSEEYQKAKEICESPIKQSSTLSSSKELVINSDQKLISLEDIREPSFEEYGAKVKISLGSEAPMYYDLFKDKTIYFDPERGQYIQLVSVDKSKNTVGVNINTSVDVIRGLYETKKQTLEKGKPSSFGTAYTYEVIEIYEKKQAKVSVTSTINRVKTDANFTFKIGIEKRAIQLSPEEIKERIGNLNETIKDIEEINDKLTKVVEGMKGACLATGLALTIKNFINNLDGQSIARQQVMTGKGGWNEKCIELVSKKTYSNVEECYIKEASQIDKDVNTLTSAIKEQNSRIKEIQERCKLKGEGLFFEEVIDTSCFMEKYSEELSKTLPSSLEGYTFEYDGKSVSSSKIVELIKDKKVSIEEMRAIELYSKTGSDSGLSGASKKELDSLFNKIYTSHENGLHTIGIANKYETDPGKVTTILVKNAQIYSYTGLTVGDIKEKGTSLSYLPTDTNTKSPVAIINLNGKDYVGLLEKASNGNFYLRQKEGLYSEGKLVNTIPNELKFISFKVTNQESYSNSYKGSLGSSVSGPVLKCYTNAPYQNYPAIVPIDTTKGWYVSISQTLPIFSSMGVASYKDSGRVMSFYICNVFKNGIEENRGGDDECTMINLGTGQSIQIGGLSAADSKKLVDEAVKVVEAGQKACQTKKAGDVFNLGTNAKNIRMGTPAASTPEASCYNFMSPNDCKILFNVCDPVICPNSRCNFGGKYTVTDVIQSGIIGSVLLCLPNFIGFQGGDVYIPVCLSGIKAGLDGYLSIIKAYRGCLQENLESGKTIGICDQIHSVYLCEFFWRQTLPLAKMIIPKSIELLMGQSVRGGGEYMSVQNAWTTAGNSMDYFVQYYSAEAYTAFKSKITQEVSDSVCKNYISGAYPEGGNILDSLTQANSPSQYHGSFQEIEYTTATNPPISQYKVSYHIYAGENSRAYYQVYLTDVDEGSYYQDTVTKLIVDTGYIEQGAAASETKDFTAISGYKKLCINVNGKEECGFKQVSSSFAVDWVADQYLLDQVNQSGITSESECVSGTASAWSLATLSAQGAASDIINPSLYNRGVIRICANENPGKATDKDTSNPRWVSVGYCGDQNLKCWLDKESVKSAVNFNSTSQEILKTTTENFLEQMKTEGKYLTTEQFKIEISKINSAETSVAKINLINGIVGKVSMNAEKGKLLLLRGDAYGELAKEAYKEEIKKEADRVAAEKAAAVEAAKEKVSTIDTPITEGVTGVCDDDKFIALVVSLGKTGQTYGERSCSCGDSCTTYAKKMIEESKKYNGLDKLLLLSIVMQESNCKNSPKIGTAGEIGIMQIIPNYVCTDQSCISSLFNPEKNIEMGALLLSKNYADYVNKEGGACGDGRYTGWDAAIRAYNGVGNKCTNGNTYVEEVKGRYIALKEKCEGKVSSAESVKNSFNQFIDKRMSGKNKGGENCNTHCYTAIQCAWEKLGCTQISPCAYSAKSGQTYTVNGNIVTMATGKNDAFIVADSCSILGGDYESVLKNLIPGDVLSIVVTINNKATPHSVIFMNWIEEGKYTNANVFEWTKKDATSNTYRFNTYDLSENQHLVYRVWHLNCPRITDVAATPIAETSYPVGKVLISNEDPSIVITFFGDKNNLDLKITNPSCEKVTYGISSFYTLFGTLPLSYDSGGDIITKDNNGLFHRTIDAIKFDSSKDYRAYFYCYDKDNKQVGDRINLGTFKIPVQHVSNYATLSYIETSKVLRLSVAEPICDSIEYKIYPDNVKEPYKTERIGVLTTKTGNLFIKIISPFNPMDREYWAEVVCRDKNGKELKKMESNHLEFTSSQIKYLWE